MPPDEGMTPDGGTGGPTPRRVGLVQVADVQQQQTTSYRNERSSYKVFVGRQELNNQSLRYFGVVVEAARPVSSDYVAKVLDESPIVALATLNRLKDKGIIGGYVQDGASFFYVPRGRK